MNSTTTKRNSTTKYVQLLENSGYIRNSTVIEYQQKKGGADMEDSPLHAAARAGNLARVRSILVDSGATVICSKDEETVQIAQKRAELTEARARFGYTPLHEAIMNSHFEVVKVLISDYGANIHAKTNASCTCASLAVDYGLPEMLRYFLKIGVSVDGYGDCTPASAMPPSLVTPLHFSTFDPKCTKILLEHGACVNLLNGAWMTALIIVCLRGSLECAKMLVDSGADVNCSGGSFRIKINVKINESTKRDSAAETSFIHRDTMTPLIAAAATGRYDVVTFLLGEGAEWQAVDYEGRTALDHAKLFLDQGKFSENLHKEMCEKTIVLLSRLMES